MTSSFGARLRQQREERGIPLSVIAGQTKIKMSLLEGLERDDLAHWPPGIFRRAYVRAYAHAIGLNAETVVSEFLSVYPEAPEVIDSGAASDATASNGGPPTRLRHLFGSAVGSLARLRRGPAIEHEMRPQGTTGIGSSLSLNTAAPPRAAEPDVPAAAEPPEAPEPTVEPEATDIADIAAAATHPFEGAGEPASTADLPPAASVDLLAAAQLCTALGRVENATEMPPLLRQAAAILGARGLIVWVWDSIAEELQPALVFGYPDKLVAQLPRLKPDADNLTAAAFRSSETLAIGGSAEASAALAVPLQAPGGCAGVLAIELPPGSEEADPVRAVAIVFAAMLAQLVGGTPAAGSQPMAPDEDRPARPHMSTAV
jgi:hypothetical protein